MWSLICLHLLVAAAGQVHGIELYLNSINEVDICGEVRCTDETSNGETIKNVTIRKHGVVLVEMNQQQPEVISKPDDRTTKGIWVMGGFSSKRALLQVVLYNSEDCNNVEYICDVGRINKLGVERVISSSGRINGKLDAQIKELRSKLETLTDTTKIDELSSSVENQKTKLESLTESVSTILSKVQTLTNTTYEQPTTCQRGQKPSLDNRYQVVYPTDHIINSFSYLCDTDGGWIVIQRRASNKTNFYRNWSSYKYGFGSFYDEFWLGLERIHQITSPSNYELNITMEFKGKVYYAHYDNFRVSGEEDNYRLSIGAYRGTAGDSLSYQNYMIFSTFDKNNQTNCAKFWNGAWWYNSWYKTTFCFTADLNGNWRDGNWRDGNWRGIYDQGPLWFGISETEHVTTSELKIRKML